MAKPQIVPHVPPQSVQVAAPLDEAAADVFQRIRSLQQALSDADRRATEAEKRAQVAELQRDHLVSDRERMHTLHENEMMHLREAHDRRLVKLERIRGLAQGGANIFLDIVSDKEDYHQPLPDASVALDAVEQELAKVPPQPIPAFLSAGPRIDGGNGAL